MHRALAEAIELFEAGIGDCHCPEDRSLVERYLSALAPILAAAVLGNDILRRLETIERLFGHTWLVDSAPFDAAFKKWRQFRTEYVEFALQGMTVNERLYALSLSDDYDQAVRSGAQQRIRFLLGRAKVDDDSINRIIESMGRDA